MGLGQDPALSGPAASNPFTAELGLLTKLVKPRVSHAKEDSTLPAPKPVKDEPGRKRRSVPPLNDQEVAVGEVQTLPTHGKLQLGVSSTNHSGLKEMLIARKARHEQAFEVYKKRTGQLEVELEARTAHVARSFKQLMALNDAELKTMFDELADDFLLQMEMDEVDSSWVRIDEELHRRFSWVTQFEADLGKVEDERRELIEAEMNTLLEALVATAHLLPPQLERLVETEAHQVNLLILANRDAHADLVARLRVDDVKRHKQNRLDWEARKAAWRRLRHDHAILTLKSYLHSPEVIAPSGQQELLDQLASSQSGFQERRVTTVDQLSSLRPPDLSRAEAAKVRFQLEELLDEEEAAVKRVFAELNAAEAQVASEVHDAAEYLKKRLAHFAAEPPEALERIFRTQLAPLIHLRAEQSHDLLRRIRRSEMRQRLKLHEDALALTSTFEGAGRIFDEHADASKALYENLRGELASTRADNEQKDKAAEMALEAALMAMRRAADKDELQMRQDEAMQLLQDIQSGYRDFHALSLEVVALHEGHVARELESLHGNLVDFHKVRTADEYAEEKAEEEAEGGEGGGGSPRGAAEPAADAEPEPEPEPPAEGEEGFEEWNAAIEASAAAGEEPPLYPAWKKAQEEAAAAAEAAALARTKMLSNEEDLWATFGLTYDPKMEAQIALDDELAGLEAANRVVPPPDPYAFSTDGGVSYQMLNPDEVAVLEARQAEARAAERAAQQAAEDEANAESKEDQPEDDEPVVPVPPPAEPSVDPRERAARLLPRTYGGEACLQPLVAPVETSVRVWLAKACLSYHEQHSAAMAERATAEAATLEKQLTRELDERLMAHRPRAGHVETDMAATRDMELLQHRERFVRHVKTLNSRRRALGEALENQLEECTAAEQAHTEKLNAIQRALGSERNNHTATLQRLSREAEAAHATYKAFMEDCYDALLRAAQSTRREVVNKNAEFRAKWVPFAEGGQFNEEERARFVDRLQKVDVDAEGEAERQAERLSALKAEQLARADAALEAFRAAYAHNLEDITHIEGLKMQQGKATADVRIVLAESAAQQTTIDEQTKQLEALLRRKGAMAADDAATGAAAGGGGGRAADVSDGDKEAQQALSMRILDASAKMREQLLRRAKFLDVIAATAMPETCRPIQQDPKPPPAEGEEAAEGEEEEGADDMVPVVTMSTLVSMAREKHEAEMIRFCEEYHQGRGERAITRPSLIPDDVEEHKSRIEAVLDGLAKKAEDERFASVKTLRLQLLSIWRLLNLMGASVFDDISATARTAAQQTCATLADQYTPLAKDLERKREVHSASLKPTLCNAGKQAELRALAQAEADRSRSSIQAAERLREDMLKAETEQAALVCRRLVHQSETMLSLLDAMVAQEDLIPADEPPEDVHHGLKKKLRMETREMQLDSSSDEPQEGRSFMTHTWAGLPMGELRPENLDKLLGNAPPPAEPPAEGAEGAEGGEPAAEEGAEASVSAELRSNMTRSHRSVISARDRTYASYKMHYAARVKEINAACERTLSEERQWTANWKKLVGRIAIEPIDE